MNLPTELRAVIQGESLFNDGVAIVAFVIAVTVATGGGEAITPTRIVIAFVREGLGGAALGLVAGWLAFLLLRMEGSKRESPDGVPYAL